MFDDDVRWIVCWVIVCVFVCGVGIEIVVVIYFFVVMLD